MLARSQGSSLYLFVCLFVSHQLQHFPSVLLLSAIINRQLFVNVVTSPKIAPPTSSRSTKGGAGGEMWSLPHAVGPVRMEKDKGVCVA